MPQACRDAIKALWHDNILSDCTNASLIRDKCLLVDVGDKQLFQKTKKGLYDAMQHALILAAGPYDAAFKRYVATLGTSGKTGDFRTRGRLVIGLGSESVLETGITLHHTYGTPVIPGSALKGLASHYCDQVRGATNPGFRNEGEYHNALFGTDDDSGHIIFHDAWLTPGSLKSAFKRDIMTPHHGDYYSGKAAAPTDFDDPNPVLFLSINGTFYISVSCDVEDENGKKWQTLAFDIITAALEHWGIGGKTSAGYGRLVIDKTIRAGEPGNSRVTIAGQPVSPVRPGNPVPMKYKIGDVVEVTREEDPHPKPGKVRLFFRAPDGIGGYFPGTIESKEGKVFLEIKSTYPEGRYDFIIPGSHPGSPAGRFSRSR